MTSLLMGFLPPWFPYAAVILAAVIVSGLIRWFTGSAKISMLVLGAGLVCSGTWYGADYLKAEGAAQCVKAVEDARLELANSAAAESAEQAKRDQARIRELEAEAQRNKEESDRREEARAKAPLPQTSDKSCKPGCLIDRNWMRAK